MARVDRFITLGPGEVSERQRAALKKCLTFYPEQGFKVWTYRERVRTGELVMPRGALHWLPEGIEIKDVRSFPKLEKHETNIVLDYKDEDKEFKGQRECIEAMRHFQQGRIHRPPGTGKTQIALYFIATVGTRTIVIVHTEDLLNQWVRYAESAVPTLKVGIIRQGKEDIQQLTVAMLQTLYRRNYDEKWWRQFGCTIVDEFHHVPAKTFDQVISNSTSRYRFGFSASKTRADKMHPLMEFNFGDIIHELEFSSPVPVTVEKVKSDFRGSVAITGPMWLRRKRWHGLINRLVNDAGRNNLIAERVNEQLAAGRSVLVLSRRIAHLQNLKPLINCEAEILAAQLVKKRERDEILKRFKNGQVKCVLATQLADEGLDIPILSCVALTFPVKHTDLVMQQVGRALREHKGKESATIIDIVDWNVKTLNNQWHSRRKAYKQWGFKIVGDGLRGRVVLPLAIRRGKAKVDFNQLKMF